MTDDGGARGWALLELGRGAQAERAFREALARAPGDAHLAAGLARAVYLQERYAEAEELAGRAIGLDPQRLGGYLILAATQVDAGHLVGALDTANRIVAMAPELPAGHYLAGLALLRTERPGPALEAFGAATRLDPEDADYLACTAAALFALGRHADAEATVEQVLRQDPQNVTGLRVSGLLQLRRGGGHAAVETMGQAVRLDPTNAAARHHMGVALKSRNPIYRMLLRYRTWLEQLSYRTRLIVTVIPLILLRLLAPFASQAWAAAILIIVVTLVVVSVSIEPVMNLVLMTSSQGRGTLTRDERWASLAFGGFALAGLVAAGVAAITGTSALIGAAIGLGLWAIASGLAHAGSASMPVLMRVAVAVGIVLGVVSLVFGFFGMALPWVPLLIGTSAIMLVLVVIARQRG